MDSGFLAYLRSSMHLRAAAAVDGPGSTCQAKLQNPKVVAPEFLSLASKVIKFSCPPGKTSSICMINTDYPQIMSYLTSNKFLNLHSPAVCVLKSWFGHMLA